MNERALGIYLNDHLAGSIAGEKTARHCLARGAEGPLASFLERLAVEIQEDRAELREVMRALGLPSNPIKLAMAWLGEKAGHVKINRRLVRYTRSSLFTGSPASSVGVEGKLSLWRLMEGLARGDSRLAGFDFAHLRERAAAERADLERFRVEAGLRAFRDGGAPQAWRHPQTA